MSTDSFEPAFLVSSEISDGLDTPALRIKLSVVKVLADGHIRNYSDQGWPREPMADLAISAQCDKTSTSGSYGWRVEFAQPYSVNLERAAEMVKVLRSIDRGMDKLKAQFGYPDTFAEYVARVATVLKVRTFGWSVERNSGWSYDDGHYRFTDIDGLRAHLDKLQVDFLQPVNA
jgi:hypothetical protein